MEAAVRRLRFTIFILTVFFLVALLFTTLMITVSPPPSPGSFLIFTTTTRSTSTILNPSNRLNPSKRDHSTYTPRHPLDPLTVTELHRVRHILSSHPVLAGKAYTLHSVVLEEPPKEDVLLRWRRGRDEDEVITKGRKASVVARLGGDTYVMTVELETGRVVIRKGMTLGSGYPMVTMEDISWAVMAPFALREFNESVVSRGVDLADVVCLPLSPGWYGGETEEEEEEEEERNKRLMNIQCFSQNGTANFYTRPIEGITVVVDLDAKQVLRISNRAGKPPIPIPPGTNTEYRYSAQSSHHHHPISMEQPLGPSFTVVDNHMISWAKWEFHLKPDPRAGMVISQVTFKDPDTGEKRGVMYKGMPSELFVPYMDPTEGWYFKTYMDAGEYGFGMTATSLDPLNDCPRNAYYMDAVFAASDGTPYVKPDMICVFERYAGDVGWRHSESPITGNTIREVRPKVTLVARMAATVGNYDYILDWEFQTDGLIRIKVGLSGMLLVKGTRYTNTSDVPKSEDLYGTLLPGNLIGTIHDHYITFYLDMDVDGPDNSFVKVNLKREQNTGESSPRKSYLKATRQVAKTEKEARVKLKLYDPSEFHVINPNKMTRVGNPVGYKVVPGANAASLLDPDDPPQRRAGFTDNQIWVTRYNRSQEWAGGLLAYQSHGEDTLATWTERDRPIVNKDIVLWYTLGFHHIPCQEDFPVMPTVTSSFDLKPVNFFERNPILYMSPNKEEDLPVCRVAAASA